ncbi:MAG: 1-deoxy-D-xylulose-5-phosphate reductoisomerase [Peptococcaceae bacterium]|nr:1-deoxy-D-xylulose-5-phosphate reductoisomerase [Peptococcaceae bacterium]
MKTISVLGSTGSIGKQTLEVVNASEGKLKIHALTACSNTDLIEQQIRQFRPEIAVLAEEKAAYELKNRVGDLPVKVFCGLEGMVEASIGEEVDMVVTAVSGSIGLLPTLSALQAGKDIALANKETLVAAGELVMKTAGEKGCSIIPVDSEHSAVFQCINNNRNKVKKIILTASGGPFFGWTLDKLTGVTPGMALKHPNWNMGAKISIDSATMMNKALEVIEAKFLFHADYNEIEVLVHPQSIIHSMVEFIDGSVIAQLGMPDMRLPIQYALSYPDRWDSCFEKLSLAGKTLTFQEPDDQVFPSIRLAYRCGERGGTLPAVMNAANEICVHAFLAGRIKYLEMFELVERACQDHKVQDSGSIDRILAADRWAREYTEELICKKS